jgi:hypothetical protein
MNDRWMEILLTILALGGQAVNVLLNLRIRNALLEQDKEQREKTDEKLMNYVLTETCHARHTESHLRY